MFFWWWYTPEAKYLAMGWDEIDRLFGRNELDAFDRYAMLEQLWAQRAGLA